jgi:hypothetical protein
MKKGISNGPSICNVCKRKKEAAIREQVQKCSGCGHASCTFSQEIKDALKKKIKIGLSKRTIPRISIPPSHTTI